MCKFYTYWKQLCQDAFYPSVAGELPNRNVRRIASFVHNHTIYNKTFVTSWYFETPSPHCHTSHKSLNPLPLLGAWGHLWTTSKGCKCNSITFVRNNSVFCRGLLSWKGANIKKKNWGESGGKMCMYIKGMVETNLSTLSNLTPSEMKI